MSEKARVFISCGQRKDSHETETADRISGLITSLGYEPYVAVREQTLLGLTENIYRRLNESEYFLFIDFARERLDEKVHRGSLFCHQELAIASFLGKPVIAFQERGVRKIDGVIGFLQANAVEFSDPSELIEGITQRVLDEWDPGWRDELVLLAPHHGFDELHGGVPGWPKGRPVKYWHVIVKNLHRRTSALHCNGYLRKVAKLGPDKTELPAYLVEHKWAGFRFPSVTIPPGHGRELDAVMIYNDQPNLVIPGSVGFCDSQRHYTLIKHSGEYVLRFAVNSSTFREAIGDFYLSVPEHDVSEAEFRAATKEESMEFERIVGLRK